METAIPLYGFGGGGGGTGASLTVTAPAGATVTVTKDGKSKTKTAVNGTAVFKGLASGVWTITITRDGDTASKTVDIKTEYAAEISFSVATIHAVYPAGTVCAVSLGDVTLTSDTSGTYDFRVPALGSWAITYQGVPWGSAAVNENGSTVRVNPGYLYIDGDECTDITGGWAVFGGSVKESGYMRCGINTGAAGDGLARTTEKIDLAQFSEIRVTASAVVNSAMLFASTTAATKAQTANDKSAVNITMPAGDAPAVHSADVSNLNGTYYIAIGDWTTKLSRYADVTAVEVR